MLKRILAIVIGLLVVAFWGFSVFDMTATLTNDEAYLAEFPPEMIAWMQGFPLWRKVVWGLGIGLGLLGGVLLVLRSRLAGPVMLAAVLLMAAAFVIHDLAMANGLEMYGREGVIGSVALIVVASLFAAAGYLLAKRGDPT
jgi:hypothetical protein